MWIKIPAMVDDVRFARLGAKDATEGVEIEADFFLDGPVTRRVAVLDLNAETGELVPGARFIPPARPGGFGAYELPETLDPESRTFNQVSVFATVCETIKLFEKPDTLGRKVTWAFGSPQLLVVPRAGTMENAFYDRASASLQFFSFADHLNPGNTIYTSLARDIVAHECGHAILDGIAPHLLDAITPQAIALHEAIGDLTALLVSIDSDKLRPAVLEKTGGSIEDATHFSAIAEDFGMARGSGALRSLKNETTMAEVARADPHDVCTVLTGALYAMLIDLHRKFKDRRKAATRATEKSVSGAALVDAANQFRRMVFRGLDLLPPGDVSFSDYGRAIIAADQAAHPNDHDERDRLVAEFVKRGIVPGQKALEVQPPDEVLSDVDLDLLVASEWAAYDFASSPRGRRLLRIPDGVPFHIAPRQIVDRTYFHTPGGPRPATEKVHEVLFKVGWYEEESNNLSGWASRRRVAAGTTLSVDHDTSAVRAVVTCGHGACPDGAAEQQTDRDALLLRLAERDLLVSDQRSKENGHALRGAITATTHGGILRVKNTGLMLHIAKEA